MIDFESKGRYKGNEKEYKRNHQKAWRAKNRSDWFRGRRCAFCQSHDDLVLHHTEPHKKITHRVWSWGKERRKKELETCIALCNKCHKKTANYGRNTNAKKSLPQRNS